MELDAPHRGLRLLSWAAAIMIVRLVVDPLVVLASLGDDSVDELGRTVTWLARLHLVDVAVVALLAAGVVANLGELRRRQLPRTTAAFAIAGAVVAGAVHLWLFHVTSDLAATLLGPLDDLDALAERLDRLRRVPLWALVGTVGYVGCLFSTVLTIRAYAIVDANLVVRELARNVGGALVALVLADAFYRFTYGLGAVSGPLGPFTLIGSVTVAALWLWCHRALGRLWELAAHHLRATADLPRATVVARPRQGPQAASAPSPAAPASAAIAPDLEARAPEDVATTPLADGPRRLQ